MEPGVGPGDAWGSLPAGEFCWEFQPDLCLDFHRQRDMNQPEASPSVNDFLAGGHAEICFNLFYTGLKRKKERSPFLLGKP